MTNDELTRWAAEEMGLKDQIVDSGTFDPTRDANDRDIYLEHLIDTGHRVDMAAPIGDSHLFAYLVDGCEYCDANQGRALILAAMKCKDKRQQTDDVYRSDVGDGSGYRVYRDRKKT